MAEYSKYNIVYRLQKWMDSVPGQTFLNYAYSWGASIVILGTLFKLTHLPGANIMLFIGMGTEVCVFFISAFDRPFDKTDDGKKIPTRVTEEYLETGKVTYGNGYDSPSPPHSRLSMGLQPATMLIDHRLLPCRRGVLFLNSLHRHQVSHRHQPSHHRLSRRPLPMR